MDHLVVGPERGQQGGGAANLSSQSMRDIVLAFLKKQGSWSPICQPFFHKIH